MGISKMRQRLGYGAADMASNLIWPMICTYLTVYYTDALLLDTAAVSLITLASKFIDAITDVLMGIIVDKTKFKSGKCRPYFLIGAIPLAITAVLAFSLPSMVSNDKVLIIAMALISFNLVSTCYTIVNTPLSAILPSLSADPGERNVLVTFRMVMAAVGSFCVTFFALPLINNFGGKADRFSYAWAIGIFSIGAVVLLAFGIVALVKPGFVDDKDGLVILMTIIMGVALMISGLWDIFSVLILSKAIREKAKEWDEQGLLSTDGQSGKTQKAVRPDKFKKVVHVKEVETQTFSDAEVKEIDRLDYDDGFDAKDKKK